VGAPLLQLILIGGAQRSGTTLLQTLLANALSTQLLPEAHILCDLLAALRRARMTAKKTRYFYPQDGDLLAFFRDCAQRHVSDIAKQAGGGSVLVLKDPNFIQVDAEAAAVFPDAIRVVTVRDPRDIAASFLRIGQREPQTGEAGKYRRRDIHFIGKKISISYAPLLPSGNAGVHLVRYEQLATRPRETLETLGRESALALSLEHLDAPAWLESDARHDAAWISELEGQRPSPVSVGAYRKILRPREIALIEQICAPVMAWAGYDDSASATLPREWGPTNLARGLVHWMKKNYWSCRERLTQL